MAPKSLSNPQIIAVVGPTASGKTRLALDLARRLGGEIISADMGQMYRHLNAGTAKPEGVWVQGVLRVEGVPYHLIDVLDPAEKTQAGLFIALAEPILENVLARGKRPILVGGSGLYVRALLEDLDALPSANPEIRDRLLELARRNGRPWLHRELAQRDPKAAERIPAGNIQRVVRALEVLEQTGRPISQQWTKRPAQGHRALYLGLRWEREALKQRIGMRAEQMFPRMVQEISTLVPAQYRGDEPGFRCLGYPQALACAQGTLSMEQGLAGMVQKTLAYAKRQRTWFLRQTPVLWLDPGTPVEKIPV